MTYMHNTKEMIGRKPREDDTDFYATDPKAVELFLEQLKRDKIILPKFITEPCCGNGNISRTLEKYGYEVSSSDYKDYGFGNVKNFFDIKEATCIITNFPYKNQVEFILHGLNISNRLICLTRTQFLAGANKQVIYKNKSLKFIYQYIKRIKVFPGNKPELARSMVDYCWLVFNHNYSGEPTFRWIGEDHENI